MRSWEFSFCFFISYAYICTCIRRHLKETIPSSSITWSEMGKQNIQAKEVYCAQLSSIAFAASQLNAPQIVFLFKLLFTPKVGIEVCFCSITLLLSLDRFVDLLPARRIE